MNNNNNNNILHRTVNYDVANDSFVEQILLLRVRVYRVLHQSFNQILFDLFPIDDFPNFVHVIRTQVFILQVIRVFPNVHAENRHQTSRYARILVCGCHHVQRFRLFIETEPSPSAALHRHRLRREFVLHVLERAKVSFDHSFQLARRVGILLLRL